MSPDIASTLHKGYFHLPPFESWPKETKKNKKKKKNNNILVLRPRARGKNTGIDVPDLRINED